MRIARGVIAPVGAVRRLDHFHLVRAFVDDVEFVGQGGVLGSIAVPCRLGKHPGAHVEHRRRKHAALGNRGKVGALGERGFHAARHHIDHFHAVERAVAVIQRLKARREILVVLQGVFITVEHDALIAMQRTVSAFAFIVELFMGVAHGVAVAARQIHALVFIGRALGRHHAARRRKPGAAQAHARLAPHQRRGAFPVVFEGRARLGHEHVEITVVVFGIRAVISRGARRDQQNVARQPVRRAAARRIAHHLHIVLGAHIIIQEYAIIARGPPRPPRCCTGNERIRGIKHLPQVGLGGQIARERRLVQQRVHVHELVLVADAHHAGISVAPKAFAHAVHETAVDIVFADAREIRRAAVGVGSQIAVLVEPGARQAVDGRFHLEPHLDRIADLHADRRAVFMNERDAIQIETRLGADVLRTRVDIRKRFFTRSSTVHHAQGRFRIRHRAAVVGRLRAGNALHLQLGTLGFGLFGTQRILTGISAVLGAFVRALGSASGLARSLALDTFGAFARLLGRFGNIRDAVFEHIVALGVGPAHVQHARFEHVGSSVGPDQVKVVGGNAFVYNGVVQLAFQCRRAVIGAALHIDQRVFIEETLAGYVIELLLGRRAVRSRRLVLRLERLRLELHDRRTAIHRDASLRLFVPLRQNGAVLHRLGEAPLLQNSVGAQAHGIVLVMIMDEAQIDTIRCREAVSLLRSRVAIGTRIGETAHAHQRYIFKRGRACRCRLRPVGRPVERIRGHVEIGPANLRDVFELVMRKRPVGIGRTIGAQHLDSGRKTVLGHPCAAVGLGGVEIFHEHRRARGVLGKTRRIAHIHRRAVFLQHLRRRRRNLRRLRQLEAAMKRAVR